MAKPKSDYAIQTVSNALRMLEAFDAETELGVSELSRRLGLHKNNVFRLLATLEEAGYIEQSAETDRYRLGTRCLELGFAFSRDHTLMKRSRPILEELSRNTGETAHLAVMRDFEVVHLDGAQTEQMLLCSLRVGQRLPAHCTALGKVLVACAEAEMLERYGKSVASASTLQPRTQATIVDSQKLLDELGSVSAQGFAIDNEECEPGMSCVAAPVYDTLGRAIAALSVSGPASRLSSESMHGDVGRSVLASASRLSQELGFRD